MQGCAAFDPLPSRKTRISPVPFPWSCVCTSLGSDSFLWPSQREMEPSTEGTEHLAETDPHLTATLGSDKFCPTSLPAQW